MPLQRANRARLPGALFGAARVSHDPIAQAEPLRHHARGAAAADAEALLRRAGGHAGAGDGAGALARVWCHGLVTS